MTLGWRAVVMGLLWLALPLQGYAAATMRHCAPSHHGDGPAAFSEPSDAAHGHSLHQHSSPGHSSPGHSSHAHVAPQSADPAPAETLPDPGAVHGPTTAHEHAHAGTAPGADSHAFDAAGKAKCSACASCCFGVALPTSSVFLPACAPEAAPPTVLRHERIGFVTDGPDRPPRLPAA